MLKCFAALLAVPMVLAAQNPPTQPVTPPATDPGRVVPVVPVDPAQGRLITLDEAIRLAQQNSPSAIQARGNLRTRSLAVRSAYWAFVPTLSTSAGLSRQFFSENENQRDLWGHSNSLSSSITWFDPLRYYDVGEAKRNVDLAEASEIQGRYSIALQVKQQYFNALNARESEAAALSALEVAQQSYRAATARVRAGSATTSDSLRALITVGNRRIELLSAQNSLRQANVALSRLVGTDFAVQADPSDTLDITDAVIDSAALVVMVQRGPVLEQERARVELARYSVKSAKTRYWPRLSSINVSRQGSGVGFYGFDDEKFDKPRSAAFPNGVDAFGYTTSCCQLTLSMTLWDNFAREDQMVNARIQAENAQATLRDQQLGQQQLLAQQIGTLRTTEAQMQVQRLSLAAAEEDLRIIQLRYELGAATQLEVTTSQDALNRARVSLIDTRYRYRLAKANIESLIGRDL
jgi:outer membrane protein